MRVIQGDLVRNNENWQDWKFQQLVDALEKWTARNPIPLGYKRNPEKCNSYSSKSYLAKQKKSECMYCENPDHRSSDCKAAKTVTEHRKKLSVKKNFSTTHEFGQRAAECHSAKACLKCTKIYTSIHLYVIN